MIGRHNSLVQKLEREIIRMVPVHCRTHRLSSVSYFTAADLYSMVYETAKALPIMEVFYCFIFAIGFPGEASDYNEDEDKRSAVAARMQHKVVVE